MKTEARYDRWLEFLHFANNTQKNNELLRGYFFEQVADAPEKFYEFIQFLEKYFSDTKNGKSRKNHKNTAKKAAESYLETISPLCSRFGFFHEKIILDDLAFKILHPDEYGEFFKIFSDYRKKSEKVLNETSLILQKLLEKYGYDADINGRYKSIYSIARKYKKRFYKSPLHLNDIFAFRIILKTEKTEECFRILNILHDNFYPIPDFFKDYITIPKINGYQSLHTGLTKIIPDLDLPVEIQIRTQSMHNFAENGIAAHWLYAKQKRSLTVTEKERKFFEYFSSIPINIDHFVYCFSYQGGIFKMKKGSTLHDFAYMVHTELGKKATGALVNGKVKKLNEKIHEGDKIQIVT